MKVVRLQIPGNFLEYLGFSELFQELEFVEILNAFQYDQKHFFALQRIKFKRKIMADLEKYIETSFQPESFQLLNQSDDEILCIMNQTNATGFFPIVELGPWAFLFPIHISQEVLLINIISQNEYVNQLFKKLSSFTNKYEIIGLSDLNELSQSDDTLIRSAIPFPKFTKRQREISRYAALNGYFKSPKRINASEIAEQFGISEKTVNKHLKEARNLAMEYFFGKYT
ncbi:MAG: helix-turn-helix domain-containing protein [Candidatus Hodarchaeota archaeon]